MTTPRRVFVNLSADRAKIEKGSVVGAVLGEIDRKKLGGGITGDTFDFIAKDAVTETIEGGIKEDKLKLLGYMIEKQRRISEDRAPIMGGLFQKIWEPLREIYVDDPLVAGISDFNVAYNQEYRYRIKSIWRYVSKREGKYGEEYDALKKRLIEYVPQCQAIIDIYVQPYMATYYLSGETPWVYARIVDTKPPEVVDFIVRPNSYDRLIKLIWICPPESQRDIAGYKVWKKERSIGTKAWGDKWTEIQETTNLVENFWIDKFVQMDKEYLYGIQVFDKHGFVSKLSLQIAARLNKNIYYDGVELAPSLERDSGSSLSNDGVETRIGIPENRSVLWANNRIRIRSNPSYTSSTKTLWIKVTSLDTGETAIIPVVIKNLPLINEL